MKKALLFSTILLAATSAFAFGGIFGGGGHKSHTYNGVDSIGVHYNGEGQADIQTSCPQHSEWSDIECVCESGWTMDGNICRPNSKPVCEDEGMYWCTTTQTCVADANACMALCPDDRKCGDICCGEGNVCNPDTNTCCYKDYSGEIGTCCEPGSAGYSTNDGGCCGTGFSPYVSFYGDEDQLVETSCCADAAAYTIYDFFYYEEAEDELWHFYEQGCCTDTIYPGVGYKSWNVCCAHEPTNYTNNKGETFKVCWTEDTECTTNEKCQEIYGNGYYCSIENKINGSPNYPDSGTCKAIGDKASATITEIGNVVKSNNTMTWWSADNWCKTQGMRLLSAGEFGCNDGKCCATGETCPMHNFWYHEEYRWKYSIVLQELEQQFGHDTDLWTNSDAYSDDTYSVQCVTLADGGIVLYYRNEDARVHALCVE